MKKFFQAIGKFFKNNYWIQPLLLVAVVFVIVFSLEGVGGVWDTVKSWFSPNSICKQCERVTVEKAFDKLEGLKEDEVVYVYYYEKVTTDNKMEEVNEQLNNFIKAYNKTNSTKVTVYAVKYAVKETGEITGEIEKWYDKTMDQDTYDKIAEQVNQWLKEVQPDSYSAGALNTNVVPCPTLVRYVGTSNGYKVDNAMRATTEFTLENLKLFFAGKYNK